MATAADLKAQLIACCADRASFCGLLDILTKEGQRRKLVLNATQRRSLRERTLRTVVLKSRQIGQTTLEQALDVHHFVTRPGSNCVVVCQSIEGHAPRNSISRRFEVMIEGLERLGFELEFEQRSETRWVLRHGAGPASVLQIIEAGASKASAQKKGRTDTITRLHMTETSVWEYAEETANALLECVPAPETGSEVVSESTPFGAAGKFYEQCQEALTGRSGYDLQFFPWFESTDYVVALEPDEVVGPANAREAALTERCGIRPEQLKWYHRKLAEKGSQELLDQEYPSDPDTCFLVSGRSFFDAARVGLMLASAAAPIASQRIRETGFAEMKDGRNEVPGVRVWHAPEPGDEYVVVADTSEGTGGSAGAAIVYERRTGRHCATLWGQAKPWVLARWAVLLARKYNSALLVVERNNHGHAVLRAASAEMKYRNVFVDRDKKPGWLNGPMTRSPALDAFEAAVREGHFRTDDNYLLREMRTFVVVVKGASERAQHSKGARDDLVLTAAIGWDVLCRPMAKRRTWVDELPAA